MDEVGGNSEKCLSFRCIHKVWPQEKNEVFLSCILGVFHQLVIFYDIVILLVKCSFFQGVCPGQIQWVVQPPLQDKKWALLKAPKLLHEQPIPVEDRCEECWQLWTLGFHWLSWTELVHHAKTSSSPLALAIQMASKKIKEKCEPERGAGVMQSKKIQLEISRVYHIATEAEIKKKAKVQKLSKAVLDRLPYVKVASEQGQAEEVCYCFKHPQHDLREARLKVVMETSLDSQTHDFNKNYFPEQSQHVWQATVASSADETGLGNVLDKEQYITTFEAWAAAKLNMGSKKAPEASFQAEQDLKEAEGGADFRDLLAAKEEDGDGAESFLGVASCRGVPLQRAGSSASMHYTPAKKQSAGKHVPLQETPSGTPGSEGKTPQSVSSNPKDGSKSNKSTGGAEGTSCPAPWPPQT